MSTACGRTQAQGSSGHQSHVDGCARGSKARFSYWCQKWMPRRQAGKAFR